MSNDKINDAEYAALFPVDSEFNAWVEAQEYRAFIKERIAARIHERMTEVQELRSRLNTTKVFDK